MVRLTEEEPDLLESVVSKGRTSAQKIKHANVLLKVDVDGPNWHDQRVADALSFSSRTVSIRERSV